MTHQPVVISKLSQEVFSGETSAVVTHTHTNLHPG